MGQSTNAILFYGIAGEEEGYPWNWGKEYDESDYESDEESKVAAHFNIDPKNYTEVWAKQRELSCELDTHCSGDYPMYFVCVKESKEVAYRGDVVRVELQTDPIILQRWDAEIKEYCDLMGIEYTQPDWFMVSYWG